MQTNSKKETLFQTLDYEKFNKISNNRTVKKVHVSHLVKSIEQKNLISEFPIIVDEKYNILDGQHRFEALKLLNMPIVYKISENMKASDISLINSSSLNWSLEDYLNDYCLRKNNNYLKVKKFMDIYNINSVSVYLAIENASGGSIHNKFKLGDYLYPENDKEIHQFAKMLDDLQKYGIQNAKQIIIIRAYKIILRTEGFDHELMVKKLKYQQNKIKRCAGQKEVIEMLEEIYNVRLTKGLRFNRI